MIQKAFTIGNSTAITLPKRLGIKPGTRVKLLEKKGNKLIYEILKSPKSAKDPIDEHIKKTSGAFKVSIGSKKLNEIIKELRENPYDKTIRVP